MVDPLYLVLATVELTLLDGKRARLLVLWTNGQRGKMDGLADEEGKAQTILLQAMSEQSTVNVSQWPAIKSDRRRSGTGD